MRTAVVAPTLLGFVLGLLLWALPTSAAPCDPLVLTSIEVKEETAGFVVDAEYPVLCREAASRTIRDWVSNTIFDFKKLEPDHDLSEFPHKYDLNIRYAVWPSPGGRYASVKLDVSVYTGGAHANHWPMTWVFDLTDGRALALDDLFDYPDIALQRMSSICREVLPAALGPMYVPEMLEAGTEPLFENYDRFILTHEGVAVFFPPYQVGPYAAGEKVVTIPYGQLDGLLRSEFRETILFR